ncbi:MAG TPA: carboxypeptidase-like regulatory domain-containing protein [Pyrinomonadaceae bacterium]|nr:carboxypeptidase-like regulatory domain-containing protein [Pyrinomonadaceae bacterium]
MNFMNTHSITGAVAAGPRKLLALVLVALVFSVGVSGQPPPNPVPPAEDIFAGALIIPMDNVNQGNAGGTTFNLRAYGLVNALLQNGVPVKWAIKPGKGKDDEDFSANVTRIAGAAGTAGPATVSFSGGPFIVTREYDTQAVRDLISGFNGGGTAVTVYLSNADTTANVRYTLTHKPKIAIGPDGGQFGAGVHQELFSAAGIPNFTSGVDDIGNSGACYTLATQAHSTGTQFAAAYRSFVLAGGNLLLQCASINTFENNLLSGHYQTTPPGYSVFGSNDGTDVTTPLVYPEGSMPFNQFIGVLANQDGAITEYSYAPGAGPANDNRVAARNSGVHSDKFVATVSQLGAGTGSVVFALGGHNYFRTESGASEIERLNGQRMILNAVFVPANTICISEPESVIGYKSVRRFNVRDGGPPFVAGDTLEWTVDYINNSQANQFDFQIRDIIGEINGFLTFVPGSVSITVLSGGAVAALNPGFDGVGDDVTSDLLAPGAVLPAGGRIQLKLRTVIDLNAPRPYTLFNQTTARSSTIAASPNTKSDAVDATNAGIFDSNPPTPDSAPQIQNGAIIDPTQVSIPGAPTAGDVMIEGRTVDPEGNGIMNALVTVVNAATGEVKWTRTGLNGYFRVEELNAGGFYLVTVTHRRFRFQEDPFVFTLNENLIGLTIVGSVPEVKGGRGDVSLTKVGR